MTLCITSHAGARMQQRGIRAEALGRDRLHGLYAVTDGRGTLITVGHRNRRIARARWESAA
jgi:hypothetical protein